VIDLHTHSTASDGKCSPEELVARAGAAGVTTLALSDHDTVAGCRAAADACAGLGIEFLPGIEITAVADGRDVHVLAYFFDTESAPLQTFLQAQRQLRFDRVHAMLARLRDHGIPIEASSVLGVDAGDGVASGRSVGRPLIARALVAGGHVATVTQAFDTWLARGRPAFVPRAGASPSEVFDIVHAAGGLASVAHPILLEHDEWIPRFAAEGLDAIEVFHSKHDAASTARYLRMANDLGLLITGGSDYHADDEHGGGGPGSVSLPPDHFARLTQRARGR
jgi:predicted metal-dependent phosphoesterase TrpH